VENTTGLLPKDYIGILTIIRDKMSKAFLLTNCFTSITTLVT